MLIKMTPIPKSTRQNFILFLDQDEMAVVVYQLERGPAGPNKRVTAPLVAQVNRLWRAFNGVPIVDPPAAGDE